MRRVLLTLAALFAAAAAFAQNSINVQVPNLVAADEQFQLVFSVEGENAPSGIEWEPGSDLQLVWGPQKSSSSSISIINGKRSKSSRVDFIYIVIPRRQGKITIPAATATVKGSTISSQPVTIDVVREGAASQGSSGQLQSQASEQASSEVQAGDDIVLRLSFSKKEAYVGETITATLKLYTRVNIAGLESPKLPVFNGFWSQQDVPANIEMQRETLNGQIYQTALLRSYTLVPQKAGDLVVDPSELICVTQERVASTGARSIFDSFFQDEYRTVRKRVSTPGTTIHVKPLPSGAPESFGGGVGSFKISSKVSTDSLKTHEAASLSVTVSGTGNISMLETPKVRFPSDFEVYDVKVTDNIGSGSGKVSGSKTFEYPFIPRSHGEFEIPSVEYSYFDIASRKYVTLTTEPVTIKVARGVETASQGGTLTAPVAGRSVRDLDSDIRYIREGEPSMRPTGSFLVFSGLFFWITGGMIALAAALYFALKARRRRLADTVTLRGKAATKVARKRLALARGYLEKDLYAAFYEELHKALLGFITDKLNMDMADMSKDNIKEALVASSVSEEDAAAFTGLLDACEMARYSPMTDHGAMNVHYDDAVQTISRIDASARRTSPGTKAVLPLLALLLCLPLGATPWRDGVAAYQEGRYEDARQAWMSVEAEGLEAVDLYYNIGNAAFKCGDYAGAILYYERALRLDPSDADVLHNLEFARAQTLDRIEEVPEIVIEQVGRKMRNVLTADAWCVLFLVLLAVSLALALVFLLSRDRSRRKLGFYAGIVTLLLSLLCLDFAQWHWADYMHDGGAIVMKAVSSVKSSPTELSAKDLFVLHEGTRVRVLETLGAWSNIELADGRQGWIATSDIEII